MTRPHLQLHLSTLLILSLLAGLVGLNVIYYDHEFPRPPLETRPSVIEARGWPLRYQGRSFGLYGERTEFFSHGHLGLDILICLALLGVAAAAIEWLTRRMKRGGP